MALSAARQQSRPLPLVVALYFAGELHWFLRDPHSARHYAEEALSLSGRQGYGLELARSTILRGWALVAQGNPEAGLAETFEIGRASGRKEGRSRWSPDHLKKKHKTR